MVLAALDPLQWTLAATAVISAGASLGGYLLQRRKDQGAAARTASTVAAEVTEAGLRSLREALEMSDRRAAAAEKRADEAWTQVGVLRAEVRELKRQVEACEEDKRGMAVRINELEAAR